MPSRQYSQRQTPVIDSSSSQVHTTRSFLKADEVCVGCVVWLPDKIETSHVGLFGQSDEVLNAEGYYHPAVILGIRPRPASKHISDLEICIALVTTFRGVTLSQYATLKQSLRSSIPIVDTASVSDSPYLHLENQRRLRKQSYVRLDNVYETNISNLRSYSDIEFPAYHWRLDENSYHKLMGLLFLKVQDYPPTDSLRSIKKIRNARITISAPGRTATQDPENVYIPHRASQETVPRLPGHSIQTYETHHSPPYIGYDSIVQLPPPTPYRTQRRQNSTSCSISSIIIFFVCLLWLFFFYAVWRAWQKFFGS